MVGNLLYTYICSTSFQHEQIQDLFSHKYQGVIIAESTNSFGLMIAAVNFTNLTCNNT